MFGPDRAVPPDGNAKARIAAYARAWSARNRSPGHKGPITRAFLDVLNALLWGFHDSRFGSVPAPALDQTSSLGRALARLGTALATKAGIEQGAGG